MDLTLQTSQQMQKVMEVLKTDLATVRAGKASPQIVENIIVSAYGGTQKLKVVELAQIHALDSQTLAITPYDASIIGEINKAIMDGNVGLTPVIDGTLIRISIPPLSEERRLQLVGLVNQKLEGGKIQIRQIRHEAMNDVKKQNLPEDETTHLEKEIQKLTDDTISAIDLMEKHKEQELMVI